MKRKKTLVFFLVFTQWGINVISWHLSCYTMLSQMLSFFTIIIIAFYSTRSVLQTKGDNKQLNNNVLTWPNPCLKDNQKKKTLALHCSHSLTIDGFKDHYHSSSYFAWKNSSSKRITCGWLLTAPISWKPICEALK